MRLGLHINVELILVCVTGDRPFQRREGGHGDAAEHGGHSGGSGRLLENLSKPKLISPGFFGNLPDAGNQRLGPNLGDHKERLHSRFGFHVMLAGHHVVPVPVGLWVQSVHLAGGLDYLRGHQAWLSGDKTIHGIFQAAVCVVGTDAVLVAAVWGRTAGAVPGDQPWIPVHVVGAFALRGGGAGAGSRGGRALSQAAVLS